MSIAEHLPMLLYWMIFLKKSKLYEIYNKRKINFIPGVCIEMKTRQEALDFGLSFPNTYQEAPFHDENWQLVRVKANKKAFLWTYEREGYIHLNVKVDPQWRDFWRSAYPSVIPGWHQNKEHWNTIILDGTVPDEDIKRMISESYDLVTDSPTKRIYEAVKKYGIKGSVTIDEKHDGRQNISINFAVCSSSIDR